MGLIGVPVADDLQGVASLVPGRRGDGVRRNRGGDEWVAYGGHLDELSIGTRGDRGRQSGGDVGTRWRLGQRIEVCELGGCGGHGSGNFRPRLAHQGRGEAQGLGVDSRFGDGLLRSLFGFGFGLLGDGQHLKRVLWLGLAVIRQGRDRSHHDGDRRHEADAGERQDASPFARRSLFDPIQIAHCSVHFPFRSGPCSGVYETSSEAAKKQQFRSPERACGGVHTW